MSSKKNAKFFIHIFKNFNNSSNFSRLNLSRNLWTETPSHKVSSHGILDYAETTV